MSDTNILFVDDEQGILKSLKRIFIDEEWEMFFAESAEEGLEIMKQNRIDVVVSDYRMPEIDGAEFLRRVKRNHPEAIRLMLTGYITQEAVTQALAEGSAQQLLAKPWKEDELREVIKSAIVQTKQLQSINPGLQKIINTISTIPELPATYYEIDTLIKKLPETSMDNLVSAVQEDISLTAELLRWANSAFFGQMTKVDTVKRAIIVLGTEVLKGLVLSRTVSEILMNGDKPPLEKYIKINHDHAALCAAIAKLLADDLPVDDTALADKAFISGLLHDLGILLLIGYLPEQFKEIVKTCKEADTDYLTIEEQMLMTNHAEIGAYLAAWWNLPSALVTSIRWHHDPSSSNMDKDLVAIVHVANHLAHQFIANPDNSCQTPPLKDAIWEQFSLSDERVAEIKTKVLENFSV